MATDVRQAGPPRRWWSVLIRTDVLAGLMFMAVAIFALWLSRNYQIGTAVRMGTGYVPRLLAWVMLGLGLLILIQDLWSRSNQEATDAEALPVLRPIVFVTASILAFGFAIERLGLVIATMLLIGIGSLAGPGKRPLETLIAAVVMAAVSVAIFILGLGLTMPIWPEW
jgi:uncharacterized membrane protein YidH (DUF202 family)